MFPRLKQHGDTALLFEGLNNVEEESMKKWAKITRTVIAALFFAVAVIPLMAGGGRAADSGKISVRYIVLQKGNPYFDPIVTGMKEAVESQGGVFRDTAPEQAEATAQIPLIEAAIQDKVNVISGAISRIVYQSLVMKYRNVLDRIQRATNKKIRIIHVCGGGSKDRLLNGFLASVANMTVKAGPSEGAAMGNLLLQAYGSGELSSIGQIREMVAASTGTVIFEPGNVTQWDQGYERFLKVL
jgi:sugar (pentulose or hexulose) kinase